MHIWCMAIAQFPPVYGCTWQQNNYLTYPCTPESIVKSDGNQARGEKGLASAPLCQSHATKERAAQKFYVHHKIRFSNVCRKTDQIFPNISFNVA